MAATVTPLTFQLPAQAHEWQQWMKDNPSGSPGQPQRMWILKTAQHLGGL